MEILRGKEAQLNYNERFVFDPTALLTAEVETCHPCLLTLKQPDIVRYTLEALKSNSALILTPTMLSTPLLVEFSLGDQYSPYRLNLLAAKLAREVAGHAGLVGGVIDLSFLESEYSRGNISLQRLISSISEQVRALKAGGVNYLFFQGFESTQLLIEITKPNVIGNLPIVFTISIDSSEDIVTSIQEYPFNNKVKAAGVTIDLNHVAFSIGRLTALASQLNRENIPLVVMFDCGYQFGDEGLEPIFSLDRMQLAFEKAISYGARIVGIRNGATLQLVNQLAQPKQLLRTISSIPVRVASAS